MKNKNFKSTSKVMSSIKGMGLLRRCNNCGEEFNFKNVKDKFPPEGREQLKNIWNNKDIPFYCTSCYFLKLLGHLKTTKHPGGE